MSERTGKIVAYFPANRQGKIKPDDNGPAALFYVTVVTNAEPAPKENDLVTFSAPSPRKNKKGKLVQDQATSVTISERAPELSPQEIARREKKAARVQLRKSGKGPRKPRSPHSADNSKSNKERRVKKPEASANKSRRKPSGRNAQNKNSIRSKVRYPNARDVAKNVFHIEQSNPSLVCSKYIQWPSPQDPKADVNSWRMSERNQNFFLTRTLAPLYRNFEKKTLPWAAVRARREALLRTLEQSGKIVASEIVRGPWRIAVDGESNPVLNRSNISLDSSFGYPIIPAKALDELLDRLVSRRQDLSSEIKLLFSAENSELNYIILDAVPTGRIKQFSIERCELCPLSELDLESEKIPELEESSNFGHGISMGEDTGMALNIAVFGQGATRKLAKELVSLLSTALSNLNTQIHSGTQSKEDSKPRAVLF